MHCVFISHISSHFCYLCHYHYHHHQLCITSSVIYGVIIIVIIISYTSYNPKPRMAIRSLCSYPPLILHVRLSLLLQSSPQPIPSSRPQPFASSSEERTQPQPIPTAPPRRKVGVICVSCHLCYACHLWGLYHELVFSFQVVCEA